jgi:hypothetical protein
VDHQSGPTGFGRQLFFEILMASRSYNFLEPPDPSPRRSQSQEEENSRLKERLESSMKSINKKLREELMMLGLACLIRSKILKLRGRSGKSYQQHLDLVNYILHCRDSFENSALAPFPNLRSYFRRLLIRLIHTYVHVNPDSRVSNVYLFCCRRLA